MQQVNDKPLDTYQGPNRHQRRAMVAMERRAPFLKKQQRIKDALDANKKAHREAVMKRHAENRKRSAERKLSQKNANK